MKNYLFGLLSGFALSCLIWHVIKQDISSSDIELSFISDNDIKEECFKRFSQEHLLHSVLNEYSVDGTIMEERWDSLSDTEKLKWILK